ncbi:MAG: hypothetical protein PVS3B3_19820 [Ktedonobacteraceae bacterium]
MNSALPMQVITTMAQRPHRMHHFLWHEIRNNWLSYSPQVQQQLTAMGWAPPRPARDVDGNVILTNNSGEDFLYMHRQMIIFVNSILSQVNDPNYPQVVGWNPIPSPGDPDFPVPPAWDASVQRVKSDDFYTNPLHRWELAFADPTVLAGMALAELGSRIEGTIHNAMHMRWASQPGMMRPGVDEPTQADANIPTDFDDPSYDYLGDTYSSHVNPLFWKLHGWVDARIEDWKAANGVTGEPSWIGTWVGNMPMDMPAMEAMPMPAMARSKSMVSHGRIHNALALHTMIQNDPRHLQNMEQAVQIIAASKVTRPLFQVDFSLSPTT